MGEFIYTHKDVLLTDPKENMEISNDFITGISFNGYYDNFGIKSDKYNNVKVLSFYIKTSHNRIINLLYLLMSIDISYSKYNNDSLENKTSLTSLTDKVFCIQSSFYESDRTDAYKYYFDAIQIQVDANKAKKYRLYIRPEHKDLLDFVIFSNKVLHDYSMSKYINRLEAVFEFNEKRVDMPIEYSNMLYYTYNLINKDMCDFRFFIEIGRDKYLQIFYTVNNHNTRKNINKIKSILKSNTNIEYLPFTKYLNKITELSFNNTNIIIGGPSTSLALSKYISTYTDKDNNIHEQYNFINTTKNTKYILDKEDYSVIIGEIKQLIDF